MTLLLPAAQDWLPECSPWPAMHHQLLAHAPSTCPAMYPGARPSAGMPALSRHPSGLAATRPATDSPQDAPRQAIRKHPLPSDYLTEVELMEEPPLVAVAHAEDQAAGAPGASVAEAAEGAGHRAHGSGAQRAHAGASPAAVPALRGAGSLGSTPARLLRALLAGAAQLLAGYSLLRLAIAQVPLWKHAQNSCMHRTAACNTGHSVFLC